MATQILTLCSGCAKTIGGAFRVTRTPAYITTEKKTVCENCKKKLSKDALAQYTVTPKRR